MNKGNIFILNGTTSSGKTTLAQAISKEMNDLFLFSIDTYDYIIEKMEDRINNKMIPLDTELFFHRTMVMFSKLGINLIVDHVLHNEMIKTDLKEVSKNYPVYLIKVFCPLDIVNKREIERGDRIIGLAKKQFEIVHNNIDYDLELNTHVVPLEENTKMLKRFINSKN